jgi:hypothetical protein
LPGLPLVQPSAAWPSSQKIRRFLFPSLQRGWLYRENRISVLEIRLINIRKILFVNIQNDIVKIIFCRLLLEMLYGGAKM